MRVFCILIFSFYSILSLSQSRIFDPYLSIGAVTSQVDGDGFGGYNKLGGTIAFGIHANLRKRSGFNLALGYTMKGSYDPLVPDQGDYESYKISMNYLEILPSYTYTLHKIRFDAGTPIGILLNYNLEDHNGTLPNDPYQFSTLEFQILLGVSYQIAEKWYAGIHFQRSVFPISDFKFDTTRGFQGGSYNRLLALKISYFFTNESGRN